VVLNTLGAEDYGIYNVVAGIVTMFAFISNAMASATQRYFSFELGRGNYGQLKNIFTLSITIYLLIALLILLLAETIGLWVLNNKLVIPIHRMNVARWIYQFSILSFIMKMMTTPYMAYIMAHEEMNVYSYISIVEVVLKLIIVQLLQFFSADKLKLYGLLIFIVTFVITIIYCFYSTKKYQECRLRFYWNYSLFWELNSYTSWNLFGAIAGVIQGQGINMLLNIYFGPIVNVARGLASQVNAAIQSFAQNLLIAVNPQIVKSYATGDSERVLSLIFRTTKAIFFLLFLFILPLQLELSSILKLWLKNVPEYVLVFTRIILINTIIHCISYPLGSASQATGRIKLYQSIVCGILILNLPLSLIVLILGCSAVSVLIIEVVLTFIAFLARIIIVSKLIHFTVWQYIKNVLIPIFFVFIIGSIMPVFWIYLYPKGFGRLFITILISIVSSCLSIIFIGCSLDERRYIFWKIRQQFISKGKN
jgi:O-antigen/teichoic acid export membrane protein